MNEKNCYIFLFINVNNCFLPYIYQINSSNVMNYHIKFSPISHSSIALNSQPKGVIQFIGGAFFGSFPTFFYQYLFEKIFEQGYTIIALPFRFSFRHWSIAIELLQEQEIIHQELLKTFIKNDHLTNIYIDKTKYFWIGHSLGCKYIALLELLSTEQNLLENILNQKHNDSWDNIKELITKADMQNTSILNQPSLLIAPDISDTNSVIPFAPIAQFIDKMGLGAIPTRKNTQDLIKQSDLFNLTALISFDKDTIAGSLNDRNKSEKIKNNSDVLWFFDYLSTKNFPIVHEELEGKHLEPIGRKIGHYIVDLNPFDKFIESLDKRNLEKFVIEFLSEIKSTK